MYLTNERGKLMTNKTIRLHINGTAIGWSIGHDHNQVNPMTDDDKRLLAASLLRTVKGFDRRQVLDIVSNSWYSDSSMDQNG
jgi:hypothetical protein